MPRCPVGHEDGLVRCHRTARPGRYQLVAQLLRPGRPAVKSLRDFTVVPESQRTVELAQGRPVTASSSLAGRPPANAVDGKAWTRWTSKPSDPQDKIGYTLFEFKVFR